MMEPQVLRQITPVGAMIIGLVLQVLFALDIAAEWEVTI
jgi:hypothetical protein